MKAARGGMSWRPGGARLLRAVSASLADQCPPPDTETSLVRLRAAARDRGLLGEDDALSGSAAAPPGGGRQAPPPDAAMGKTVILADPAPSRYRRQRRSRPLASLAAATAVALIVILAAVLGSRGHHRPTRPSPAPPVSPAQSASPAAPIKRSDIVGTWTGHVRQANPPLTARVKITVPAKSGAIQISYVISGAFGSLCSGTLTPLPSGNGQMALSQAISRGACANGSITLTWEANGNLNFRFVDALPASASPATGTVSREAR